MALCDNCGNYDESYKKDLDYSTDSHLEAQDYQPDLYYYWDSPIERITIGVMLCQMLIVYVRFVLTYSIQRKKLNGCANNISVTQMVDYSTLPIIM